MIESTPTLWSRARSIRRSRIAAAVVGLAIGAAVLWVSRPETIWESLQEVGTLPLLGALLLNVPVVALRALRAKVVLRFLGYGLSFMEMIPVQLVGQTSSSITPAASGDYVRAYIWRRTHEIPLRAGAAVVTFERLYSLFLLVAVAVLLIVLPRHGWFGWVLVALGLAAATFAPTILELIAPPAIERYVLGRVTRGRLLGKHVGGVLEMADNLRQLLRSPVLLTKSSAITLTIYILSGIQVWLLLIGLNDIVRITQAVAVYAVSQVAGILSTLPFGIGASDATLVAILAGYGVTVETSATVAVLLRGVATLPQALAGLIAYLRLGGLISSEPAMTSGAEGAQ